ncbi:MAG: pyruvate ferredoxin oxidoreductase [Candidatus Aenigmarchaeota archaeon]|nr:pyruvate ferredoxin oxidoreductase [Candidatus Aenigmarchaeota archaeon]
MNKIKQNNFKIVAITGAEASAQAMRQINPEVIAAYPITPQTPIIMKYAQFVADGVVDTELVPVESEHSAQSVVVGASAAGVRAMTATSSAGLALMGEILGVASGLRLPIVMNVVNRAISAPINIHCDHSDSMGTRDHGWIQIYCESAQEAYEYTLIAVRLAESKGVSLPVMIMQDGFITSHGVENVKLYSDSIVKKFLGKYHPKHSLLDTEHPVTVGPLVLPDYLFEIKRQQQEAIAIAKKNFLLIGKEFSKISGQVYNYFEKYRMNDAQAVIVTMSSTVGTVKQTVDNLRKQGKKVGLLKIKMFRPFPYMEVARVLKNIKIIGVLDRSFSFGAYPPLVSEIRNALFNLPNKQPIVQSYVFGIGGRDIKIEQISKVFQDLLAKKYNQKIKYIGLRN